MFFRSRPFILRLIVAGSALVAASVGPAAEPRVEFNRDVRPILSDNCFSCHGQDAGSRKARLRLDDRAAALLGGKSGSPAIVPGKPDESELLHRVTAPHDSEDLMPTAESKKSPLTRPQLATLRRWIAEGAEYQGHWAFVAPVASARPKIENQQPKNENPIDAAVAARLRREKLAPAPAAAAATLARRLYLDTIGLPPTPEEVTAFERATIENPKSAIENLTDRLLARPTYGEKWARHWLDAARYADSNGYEKDLPREQWAWRDWVINALNRDLP